MKFRDRTVGIDHATISRRGGIALHEVLIVAGLLGILLAVLLPQVQQWREHSRSTRCQQNLQQLILAVHAYEETFDSLPLAAIWKPIGEHLSPLHDVKRTDLVSHENWLILLLPYLNQADLSMQWQSGQPIGALAHASLRTTSLPQLVCPSDRWSSPGNPHEFAAVQGAPSLQFARGNYAINGGTHNHQLEPPTTSSPRGDLGTVIVDYERGRYAQWGNGIAGINRAFTASDITNSRNTLIALEELRAGVHPLDPRGSWALGQIGASITWGHGVNGDDFAPNHSWPRADDIQGCAELTAAVGTHQLQQWGMPCVDYVDLNRQATARSLHPDGVHVAFLDGHIRFIDNNIDPGLWHVLHSRETPASVLDAKLLFAKSRTPHVPVAPRRLFRIPTLPLTNSVGMEFKVIPAGEFRRDLPDHGLSPPHDRKPRLCQLTDPFLLQSCEVSIQQYVEVMDTRPAAHANKASDNDISPQMPCVNVTWDEANAFCERLSQQESSHGRRYRLPTEAEWEYACRAGKSQPFYYRAQRLPDDTSGIAAGVEPALPLTACGHYPANEFGLHDMRGNAWEWCQDWFSRTDTGESVNPQGPKSGYVKVVRGGDWRFVGEPCLIDYAAMPPFKANPYVGFRVVCELIADH